MKSDVAFTAQEKRLLHDFLYRRPKYLSQLNALIGVLAITILAWLFPNSFMQVGVATLSGTLIGVYFEQRHISELRAIIKKLFSNSLSIDN
jgi:hypothetical protein